MILLDATKRTFQAPPNNPLQTGDKMNSLPPLILVTMGAICLCLAACPSKPKEEAASTSSTAQAAAPADMDAAKKLFDERCSVCHGKTGKGDGPGAAALKPPPRNLSLPDWQKSVTDDHIRKIILSGGIAVGKSPLMPPNPDLKGKDAVINGLVQVIRSLKD